MDATYTVNCTKVSPCELPPAMFEYISIYKNPVDYNTIKVLIHHQVLQYTQIIIITQ